MSVPEDDAIPFSYQYPSAFCSRHIRSPSITLPPISLPWRSRITPFSVLTVRLGQTLGALQHPLYHPGGTACVLAPAVERRPRVGYRQRQLGVQDDDMVVALHRQNQVRKLEDTWPIDGLCIYNYQLATQIDRMDKSIHLIQILIARRTCD